MPSPFFYCKEPGMDELVNLFAAVDRVFLQVAGQYPGEVRCGAGCVDCCQAVFDLSLVEAVHLRRKILVFSPDKLARVREAAELALGEWKRLVAEGGDPSLSRICCPLLDRDSGKCMCYEARPVNCRTYGVPTEIEGKAHVCGLSGFTPGISYPVIRLATIQSALREFSLRQAGQAAGNRRFPVAAAIIGDPLLDSLICPPLKETTQF